MSHHRPVIRDKANMASIVYSVCSALFLIVLVASASALPKQDEARSGGNSIQTEDDLLNGIYADCLKKDSIACVKYKLFSFVDKVLGQKDTITVTDGLTIIKTGEPEGAPRSLDGGKHRIPNLPRVRSVCQPSQIIQGNLQTARSYLIATQIIFKNTMGVNINLSYHQSCSTCSEGDALSCDSLNPVLSKLLKTPTTYLIATQIIFNNTNIPQWR